jgi:hypothetical protein
MTKREIAVRPALVGLLLLATGPLTLAEEPAAASPPPSLSRNLGLHAYPAKSQVAAQQQKDEVECYQWAAQDSGFNPLAAVGEQPAGGHASARSAERSLGGGDWHMSC